MKMMANKSTEYAIEDYRYERKFIAPGFSKYEIEAMVKHHPVMFSEIFHERCIYNIYFDSINMKNYFDNVDGLRDRAKYRIRWYDRPRGEIQKPVLEKKIKNGFLGRKESYPLFSLTIEEIFDSRELSKVFKSSELSDELKLITTSLNPVMLNWYKRKYFRSADGNYRITIDSNMEYFKILPGINNFMNNSFEWDVTLIELKYDFAHEENAANISNFFPFRLSKNSKYVNGIDRLWIN